MNEGWDPVLLFLDRQLQDLQVIQLILNFQVRRKDWNFGWVCRRKIYICLNFCLWWAIRL